MEAPEAPQWAVVGKFRRRPVPQGEILDLLSVARSDAVTSSDAPILLYDMALKKGASAAGGGGAFSPDAGVEPSLRVPRYVARRIDIPPPSAQGENLKSISLAPPVPLRELAHAKDVLNIDCSEYTENPTSGNLRSTQVSRHLVLVTRLPSPSLFFFLALIVFFLGEVAILVVSLTTRRTTVRYLPACCLLVIVPSGASLTLIAKRGSVYTTVVLHMLLWSNVIMLYLQPFTSSLFFAHYILALLTGLFVMRLRESSRSTIYHLS